MKEGAHEISFGINEAHGRGVALQFNYLVDEGAISVNETRLHSA